MIKTGWKKLAIWALVISTLSGVVVGSQVMAIKTSEALEKMKEAGKIQLVTNVFSKCMTKQIDMGLTNILYDYPGLENIFMNTNWTNTEIPTGAWLENQVQGKVNNGTIYCDDNDSKIFDVFVSTMSVSQEEVLCNGEKPGIVKLQTQDSDGKWEDVTNYCMSGLGNSDYRFVWNDKNEALKHLKKLYDAKKKNNDYMVAWGDRGTFSDDLINYFLYFNDFATACSNSEPFSGDESLMNKTKYYGPIKVPNPSTGKMDERYYPKGGASKYGDWDSNWINSKGAHTCDAVIKRINETASAVKKALDKTEKDDDGTKPDDVVGDITEEAGDETSTGEQASPCSTAAASLGWIICPVIQGVGTAVDGIYDYIEESYLQTDVRFMDTTEKDASGKEIKDPNTQKPVKTGTYTAWETFRTISNIVFVIALTVIILSQITGFGVSNYGVKKMLPSLIIVAILVNISFFLCQLAVDISNIVGYGINQTFSELGTTTDEFGDGSLGAIVGNPSSTTSDNKFAGVLPTLLSGGVTIGVGAALIASAGTWIWPFLLVLLGAAISVIFFFILLGIRQAGIIILVTLAPVAIVCYALPNTKNIFSRWWKMLFGLLLVYPICGALMGGGQFASRLLLANIAGDTGASFFYVLIAMLIQVVPFFFVPSIVKSSFAAMGNLGMKLSNFGRGLGRGATGAIRRSEGYRDRVARGRGWDAQRAINRSQKTTGLRGLLNRPGNALRDKSHQGKIATMARESHNRKMNRLQGTALAQNLANRDRSDYYEQKHIDEVAGDYASTWDKDGTFASEQKTATELERALNDLRVDSTNTDARARFTAAMRSLNTSDKGREYVDSTLNKAVFSEAQAGRTGNEGVKWASNAVRKAAGGEYKAKTPNAFANMMDYAEGNARAYNTAQFSTITRQDKDGNTETLYVRNRQAKARDIGAEQLAGTDDSYRRDILSGLADGSITGEERNNIISQAREAINNENISVKGDVERDLQKIANMDYAPSVGSASSNASVNTVDGGSIRRMASASQGEVDRIVRGVENGTITGDDRTGMANVAEATLNAANAGTVNLSQETADKLNRIRALDGRSEIAYTMRVQHNSGNGAPVPSGFEENGSGIVIPRNGHSGDMTGSQIRDFERQMRQHNNGGNNNGGGGIILP